MFSRMWVFYSVLSLLLFLPSQVLSDTPYFVVNHPSSGEKWVNDQTNFLTWTIGATDALDVFDVQLTRMSTEGINYVARNVPVNAAGLPIILRDVPAGDDYYVTFINSTHGLMYSLSQRFTILPNSSGQSSSNPPFSKRGKQTLATVTVSGAPNPTSGFAYTFAPTSGSPKMIKVTSGVALVTAAVIFVITGLL